MRMPSEREGERKREQEDETWSLTSLRVRSCADLCVLCLFLWVRFDDIFLSHLAQCITFLFFFFLCVRESFTFRWFSLVSSQSTCLSLWASYAHSWLHRHTHIQHAHTKKGERRWRRRRRDKDEEEEEEEGERKNGRKMYTVNQWIWCKLFSTCTEYTRHLDSPCHKLYGIFVFHLVLYLD